MGAGHVGEGVGCSRRQLICPHEEARHLLPGDGLLGTEEAGRATEGYTGGGDAVDVGFVDRSGVVGESITSLVGQRQGPHQEAGHLAAADRQLGTEPVVERGVASQGDARCRRPLDVGRERVAVVVGEAPHEVVDRPVGRTREVGRSEPAVDVGVDLAVAQGHDH